MSEDVGKIRDALSKIRNASGTVEVNAAKAEALTLGTQVAATIPDKEQRRQFARSLGDDIDDAASGQ